MPTMSVSRARRIVFALPAAALEATYRLTCDCGHDEFVMGESADAYESAEFHVLEDLEGTCEVTVEQMLDCTGKGKTLSRFAH